MEVIRKFGGNVLNVDMSGKQLWRQEIEGYANVLNVKKCNSFVERIKYE